MSGRQWRPSKTLMMIICVAAVALILVLNFVFFSSESHAETLRRHGIFLEKKKPVHEEKIILKSQEEDLKHETTDHEVKNEEKPKVAVPEKHDPEFVTWHRLKIPVNEEWDFHGLKVPVSTALSRAAPGQIKADYDYADVHPDDIPKGYTFPETPDFLYPERNDRLFHTVSTVPRALFFPELATPEEAQLIMDTAMPRLARSQVALSKDSTKKKESNTQEVRTSKSTWVNLDGKLEGLEKRVTGIMRSGWHEPMNVLRYGYNQHYDAHHDYFDPNMYGEQNSNRFATIFFHLNYTNAGGATTLPRANNGRNPPDYKENSCNRGLQIYPLKPGSAILFYGMRPDKSLDPHSLHGGCDVKDGSKWAGAIWFRVQVPKGAGKSHE